MTPEQTAFAAFMLVLGIVIGICIGYVLWRRGKAGESRLTDLQAVSFIVLILYIFSPVIGLPEPNITIASLFIGLAGGEAIGAAIAQVVAKSRYVDTSKDKK